MSLYRLARPLLFSLDEETSHHLALRGAGLAALVTPRVPRAPVRAMGLEFPNPIGLAAGLDKNAEHIEALGALGFGFLEVGTVTPRPQAGNPRPRLFRLPAREAIINRFGFNNVGVGAFLDNVRRARWNGVLGINIGKNADTPAERAIDGILGLRHANEAGGLSGAPIRDRATSVLRAFSAVLKNEVCLIGAGGIMSGRDAAEKFAAGASLVQLYTGLIYRGPALIAECASAYRGK